MSGARPPRLVVGVSGGSGMPYAQNHLQTTYPALPWRTGARVGIDDAAAWAQRALQG